MLSKEDVELLSAMDFQVINNGFMGWLANHRYRDVFEYIELLNKRNTDIDQKVAFIFKRATIAGMEYYQYSSSTFIPELKEICDNAEMVISECESQYQEIAKIFMNSYGLEDYLTKFGNSINK